MPPKTLSRAEFLRTPVGRKPGSSYENYLTFIAKRRASKLGAVNTDPLAPTPPAQMQADTTAAVKAQIDPIVKEILAGTDRSVKGIESLTSTHATRLEPFEDAARARYGRATQASAGVAEAMADRLAGRGAEEAGGLKEKLAAINAPDALVNELASGTTGFATGAANAGFGIDSAGLDELISHGATAEDIAAALPGIARIAGVRNVGDARLEGQRQVGEVRAQVPGLVANLMESGRDREVNKGIAKLGLTESRERLAADQQQAQSQAAASAAQDAAEARKPDSALSNTLGYLVTENGVPILDASGAPIPTQGAKDKAADVAEDRVGALKARTDAIVAAKGTARKLARNLYKGEKVENAGGRGKARGKGTVKRVSTAEAIRQIMAELQPSLGKHGIKPGGKLWDDVMQAVRDAVRDAGFGADPARAADAAEQKPRRG